MYMALVLSFLFHSILSVHLCINVTLFCILLRLCKLLWYICGEPLLLELLIFSVKILTLYLILHINSITDNLKAKKPPSLKADVNVRWSCIGQLHSTLLLVPIDCLLIYLIFYINNHIIWEYDIVFISLLILIILFTIFYICQELQFYIRNYFYVWNLNRNIFKYIVVLSFFFLQYDF